MPDGIRWVGLDVHAHESTIAIFDQGTGELTTPDRLARPVPPLRQRHFGARAAGVVTDGGARAR
jgi:hypothetical protein